MVNVLDMPRRTLSFILFILLMGSLKAGNSPADSTLVYPQIAVGGGFETLLLLTNPSASTWMGELRIPEFGAGSSVKWSLNGEDQSGQDRQLIEIGPWSTESYLIGAGSDQAAIAGSLWIVSNGQGAATPASTLFIRFDTGEELVDEVSTSAVGGARRLVFPAEIDGEKSIDTGLALRFAPPDLEVQAEPELAPVRAYLLDGDGLQLEEAEISDPTALFIDELFAMPAGEEHFVGSVFLDADRDFFLTVLRQRLLPGGRFQLTSVDPVPTDEPLPPAQHARYRVTFEATWSSQTHPDSFPPGAHFSPLIGGTHNQQVSFWQEGEPASPGIEAMAERGLTSPLDSEVQAAIGEGTAGAVLRGSGTSSPGSVAFEFEVDLAFPLVTLVTMVAPSPDWFVGVSSLPLFSDGQWLQRMVVSLQPYDAGTDSGISFLSPNDDTQPQQPIQELTGAPFLNQDEVLALGTFTFTRIRSLSE